MMDFFWLWAKKNWSVLKNSIKSVLHKDAVQTWTILSDLGYFFTVCVWERKIAPSWFCVGFQNARSILSVGAGRRPASPHAVQIEWSELFQQPFISLNFTSLPSPEICFHLEVLHQPLRNSSFVWCAAPREDKLRGEFSLTEKSSNFSLSLYLSN